MLRLLIGIILIVHGLIVAAQSTGAFGGGKAIANPSWLKWWPTAFGQSWLLAGLGLEQTVAAWLAGLLWLVAGVALVAAGLGVFGVLVPQGWWRGLAMNFAGPFALTQALLTLLQRSAPARIVNITSAAIGMWKGEMFADIHSEQSYLASQAYARSKLFNILWTFALARRLEGSGVIANAADPGTAWTSMTAGIEQRGMPRWVSLIWPLFRWLQRRGTAENAARSSIFLASAPEAASMTGTYIGSNVRPARPPAAALDRANQEKTWELAATLVSNAPTAIGTERVIAGGTPAAPPLAVA